MKSFSLGNDRIHIPRWLAPSAAALVILLSCSFTASAAEFRVVDKLTSNGYAVLKSSAEVRGLLGISTGTPYAALDIVSTGTASNIYAQIWRNGSGVEVASMTSTGVLYATIPPGAVLGDNLGSHIATTTLNMAQFPVINVSSLAIVGDGLRITTSVFAGASGIFVSTSGQIMTMGLGNGTALPSARGIGAVDLQTSRDNPSQVAGDRFATIGGGKSNTANGGWYTTVSGGGGNTAGADDASIGGGWGNTASGAGSTVSGGDVNTASGDYSAVGGGENNTVTDYYSTVSGGVDNSATDASAVVAGGSNNAANGWYSSIGGGRDNVTAGYASVVAGGSNNRATADNAAVSGGDGNVASGLAAAIPGGWNNSASGEASWAGGSLSSSTAKGSFTWSDGQYVLNINAVEDRTVFKNRGGFLITGSTNPAMTGALDRGMFVTGNGLVGISTGVPGAALDVVSTGTTVATYAQIWRDSNGVAKASMTANGVLYATIPPGVVLGDNLGNHTATQDLDMGQHNILNVSSITGGEYGIYIATSAYPGANGIQITSWGAINTTGVSGEGVAGDDRGNGAVDLQTYRDDPAQVASGAASFIGGGGNNAALGGNNVIAGGWSNTTSWNNSAIGGGAWNTASEMVTTVAGGEHNTAGGYGSTVSGGQYNSAGGVNATVAGGLYNTGSGDTSMVSGGDSNTASGEASVISGGMENTATELETVVAGGYSNDAGAMMAAVSGGGYNEANGIYSVVPGGAANSANGSYSFAAGYGSSSTVAGAFTWSDSQGSTIINSGIDRTVFKNRGGFKITAQTGAISANLAMLEVVSTGTASNIYAQIWRNGSGVVVASMTSQGVLYATVAVAGDNLGNHTATQDLDMAQHSVINAASMTMVGKGLQIGTDLTASANGIFISTAGSIMTIGLGNGSALPNARGIGAVDLQTYRVNAASVASGAYAVITGGYSNTAKGGYAFVGGGYYNSASSDYSTVGGGRNNEAFYTYSTVAGGQNNRAGQWGDFIGGGSGNLTSGGSSFIGGGDDNVAEGINSVVGGGYANIASENTATISGGDSNIASGAKSTVAGGAVNAASGYASAVSGGENNSASGGYSWAGGYYSSSTANGAFTWSDSQGVENINSVADRTVFKNRGGFLITGSTNPAMTGALDRGMFVTGNGLVGISTGVPYAALDVVSSGTASNIYAQIWRDGSGNIVSSMTSQGVLYPQSAQSGDNLGNHIATTTLNMAQFPVINVSSLAIVGDGLRITTSVFAGASGIFISTSGQIMTMGLGNGTALPNARGLGAVDLQTYRSDASQVASGLFAAIAGGEENTASGVWDATVGGGWQNTASGEGATVSGGWQNTASGLVAVTGGGDTSVASGDYSAVSGGYKNTASGNSSAVSGGYENMASGDSSAVSGGYRNTASDLNATISGGSRNTASGENTAVSGGDFNTASKAYATVSGGYENTASGYDATVSGGYKNTASNDDATVSGGSRNTANGQYSWAGGYYSSSTVNGSFTWSDSQGVLNQNSVADRTVFKNRGGFLITGSTNPAMTGALDRGMLVTGNGLVGISTGMPYAALDVVSSGTASNIYAQIWRDGSGNIVSSMTSQGVLYPQSAQSGDNLGNHIATTTLQMGVYGVNSSSAITAAYYQIAGSTVLAVLPGTGSFGVGPGAGRVNAVGGNYNVYVGKDAGYSNTTGDDNVFVGYTAGHNNTTGTDNVFLGEEAGYYNVSGKWNFYLGTRAGIHSTSNDNIFIGSDSGYTNTTGAQNMFIGSSAGTNNDTGSEDIFMGYYAGHDNVSGGYNTYVGLNSGYSNVSGQMNSIYGYKAGLGVSGNSYSNNSLFGYYAGKALTTGSNNLLLGWQAGDGITSGTNNIVIGYNQDASAPAASSELNIGGVLFGDLSARTIGISTRAPQAALDIVSTGTAANIYAQIWRNGSGVEVASMTSEGTLYATVAKGDNLGNHTASQQLNMNNFAIWSSSAITAARYQIGGSTVLAILPGYGSIGVGMEAGKVNSGASNSFIGNTAGQSNTEGAYNTFVGDSAGSYNTIGSYNTFAGALAGQANTWGVGNSFFGYLSGIENTYGQENTFLGTSSGGSNTTGSLNTFIGGAAGFGNIGGEYNSYIGSGAGYGAETGSRNTLAGADAGSVGPASDNTMLGYGAGFYNLSGGSNTIVGSEAGYGQAPNPYAGGVLVGYRAGYNLTTGSDNIFLGWQAGYNVTIGSGNIIIGYNIDPSGATANNEINIGGVYKGLISSGTATIGKFTVQAADTGITLTSADFGKTITVNNASAQTVTLPSVTAADIGATITIVKLGAGRVTIQAAASTYIASSTSGGTIYNTAVSPAYAAITIRLVTATQWMIISGDGAWIST